MGMLIAGREYFYSYAKTFANVKFSICTGKERVFSVKGCVLSKQVVNLTLASLCVRVKVLPSSDQIADTCNSPVVSCETAGPEKLRSSFAVAELPPCVG